MNEQEQLAVASQLSCPTGEDGLEMARYMNDTNAFIYTKAIEALELQAAESIAEIGPGNAVLSLPLIKALGEYGSYMGVEKSPTMAEAARQTLANSLCSYDIYCGSCLDADIASDSLDAIIGVNMLYFIDDLDSLFRHIIHWLKPGGRVIFALRSDQVLQQIPFTQYKFAIRSTEMMTQALSQAGFDQVSSHRYEEGEVPLGEQTIMVDSVILSAYKPGRTA